MRISIRGIKYSMHILVLYSLRVWFIDLREGPEWWCLLCANWLGPRVLGVSVRVSLDEIRIWICRLSKVDSPTPTPCGWASSPPLRTWVEQKGRGKNSLSLPDHMARDIKLLPLNGDLHCQCSWNRDYNWHHWLSWFSSLYMADQRIS